MMSANEEAQQMSKELDRRLIKEMPEYGGVPVKTYRDR